MNRFQFVEDHKDAYGVKRLCEVVEIARSSFYAWLAAAPRRAAKAAADEALAARIRVLQDPAQGAIEEALIVRAGGTQMEGGSFQNLIHSISPKHEYYGQALEWGQAWLRRNGL